MADETSSTPPEGFDPNYENGDLTDYIAQTIDGDGYSVEQRWTNEQGRRLWVDVASDGMTLEQAHALADALLKLIREA